MARTFKGTQARQRSQFSIGNLLGLILIITLTFGLFYYGYTALISRDWLWFQTSFDEQPRRIAIVDQGQRTELDPSDPRFAPIAAAFNTTIEGGYRHANLGFSRESWQDMEQQGLFVETTYMQPVRLHITGGFAPTNRLRLLLSGQNIHTTQTLFRSNPDGWDSIPLIVTTVEPLKSELARFGFGAAR
jgi:hypothetical protein